ncbi:MAG: hypothetical protein H7840_13440 [Alphaproteobacteria bacterium]
MTTNASPSLSLRRLAAILAVLLIAGGPQAWAGDCPERSVTVDFRFDSVFAEPAYDNSKPKSWIETRVGGNPNTRAQTETHLATNVNLGFSFLTRPDGRGVCAYLNKAHFRLGFDKIDVYIANKYPVGTCQYDTLRKHEAEHVAIARAALDKARPEIEAIMKAEAGRTAPVLAADTKAAGNAIGEALSRRFKEEWKRFEAGHGQTQKGIDTQSSYKALEALCPTW